MKMEKVMAEVKELLDKRCSNNGEKMEVMANVSKLYILGANHRW